MTMHGFSTAVLVATLFAMTAMTLGGCADSDVASDSFTNVAEPTPSPAPTVAVTPSPVPTPTPLPIPAIGAAVAVPAAAPSSGDDSYAVALLYRAIADENPHEVGLVFDRHRELFERQGSDAFPGLADALLADYTPSLRGADQLVVDGRFDQALQLIDRLLLRYSHHPHHAQLLERRSAFQVWAAQSEDGVEWTESVPHLFIHSLIVNPDQVFDGDFSDAGYREYMITDIEFERSLVQLHQRGFILVDAHDLYDETDTGIEPTPLMVPAGKQPLLFSIDDVSYYQYMTTDGFPDRLEIDENANVATVMVIDGVERLTLTGDAMPILDRFVLENPDFSLGGAKGILALTGYEGVFGYDISEDQVELAEFPGRVQAATEIATRLHELGWDFASHSYTHDDALRSPNVSYGRFVYDTDRWADDIDPVLGGVDLYISPFGFDLSESNPRLHYLVENGFNVFMPISADTPMTFHDDHLRLYRTALDGFMLEQAPHLLADYVDAATVWDSRRDD